MRRWLLLFSFSLVGCAGLAAIDTTSLQEARKAAGTAYDLESASDAGSPARAFDRAAYCAIEAVLRRNDAGGPPAPDGGIQCQP